MAHGSSKRADNIRMGDKMIVNENKIVTVDDLYTGHEKELMCVQTDSGNGSFEKDVEVNQLKISRKCYCSLASLNKKDRWYRLMIENVEKCR